MLRVLVSQSQDAVKFEWFDKGLISLHQKLWQGRCLELHITIQHYTEYPEKSVKSNSDGYSLAYLE